MLIDELSHYDRVKDDDADADLFAQISALPKYYSFMILNSEGISDRQRQLLEALPQNYRDIRLQLKHFRGFTNLLQDPSFHIQRAYNFFTPKADKAPCSRECYFFSPDEDDVKMIARLGLEKRSIFIQSSLELKEYFKERADMIDRINSATPLLVDHARTNEVIQQPGEPLCVCRCTLL